MNVAVSYRGGKIFRFKEDMCWQNYLEVKNIISLSKVKLKAKRINHFRKFCSGINRNTSPQKIWKVIMGMKDNRAGLS